MVTAVMTPSATPEIYLGGLIEQRSERDFLVALVEHLTRLGSPAIILANVFLPGRQVDVVVATEHGGCVVEVKASRLAVQGDLNGPWARRHADGTWRPYRNAYQQALEAKFAVRDALTAWDATLTAYPAGAVVFMPAIPAGSNVTGGDNKAAVRDLVGFLQALPTSGASAIPLATWRTFASHLNLERADPDHAFVDDVGAAETARSYRAAFTAQYGPLAAAWLPEDEAQVEALMGAATGAGVHLAGQSGCGKSLMAHRLAVELTARGHPVIFVAGKDVAASWRDTVAREIGLLVDDKPVDVVGVLKAARLPLVLVVDGLNEIRGDRANAVRGVLAMARRYDAMLVITEQAEAGQAFAGLNAIPVPRPSLALKRRIASAGSPSQGGHIDKALEAVSSGLEAAVIGQVKAALPAGTTRLQLLERYARERLGGHARNGTRGLRRLAAKLYADVAYSLPEVAFDEFMSTHNVDAADADALMTSGLLVRRADRISFGHELFLAAFAAFDVANFAVEHPVEAGQRLSTAHHARMAADIVSAIDDAGVVRAVLEATSNASVLASAAEGELGPLAASVANALLTEAAAACAQEFEGASLELNAEGKYPRVDWAETGLREWSLEETARLHAIGETAAGVNFDLYMDLCAKMDAALALEWRRLLHPARSRKIGLRTESFALAYYNFGRSLGFNALRHTRSHGSDSRASRKVAVSDLAAFTSGQLHFVLESRYAFLADDDEAFAAFLTETFGHRYRFEPYHVRLSLLTAAGFVRNISPEAKDRLIAAIQALETSQNWALNSAIIDALKFLGALDDEAEAQRDTIKGEIRQALADPETEDRCSQALSVCVAMFDHPFDSIYSEQITALDEPERHTLLRRAVSAPETRRSMSLTWIIEKVVDLSDPRDGLCLQRFAALPDRQNFFLQEEWWTFVMVTRFLGRHVVPLPEVQTVTAQETCLSALRSILYACEAGDDDLTKAGWRTLGQAETGVAVRSLSAVQRALSDRHTLEDSTAYPRYSLSDRFTDECLTLSRAYLDMGVAGIFEAEVRERGLGAGYALECIARHGDRTDIARVRALTQAGPYAQTALATLRILDAS